MPADLRLDQQGLWRSRRRRARADQRRLCARRSRRYARHGIGEARPLDFHTPYGCSKGAADQYVLDYARSFGVPTAVLRMSCIYGPRQMGTEDQGWVAHFAHPRAGRPSRSRSSATAARCATSSTSPMPCDAYLGRVAQHRPRGGPRLQPRRRPGERRQPAQLLARTSRRCSAAPVRRRRVSIGAPGDQRYFVVGHARVAPSALGLPRRIARGRTASTALVAGSLRARPPAARRRTAEAGDGGRIVKVALVNPRLGLRRQHLLRLPPSASAARTRLLPRRCSSAPDTRC